MTNSSMIGNRYQIQEQIGAGGMGTVFRGVDMQTSAPVAIKLLKAEAAAYDPDAIERFMREAEVLRQLNHPNMVKVLASMQEDDRHYIVMEYVRGGSLNDLLRAQPMPPISQVLKISIELADALTRAHYLKIIHRDIKPANVLIEEDGASKLTDFGVAYIGTKERVTQMGALVGTPDYMAPEVINGEDVDTRADIWSFGVMLFEMLAGRRPFGGESLSQVLVGIMSHPTPDLEEIRPDVPSALLDLIYRMLEKDRVARIPSVRLVGAELEAIIDGVNLNTDAIRSTRSRIMAVPEIPMEPGRFDTTAPITHAPKHNLPAQTTPFVGRELELAELKHLIDDPDLRLITILGPGGMGKTRLALEAAASQVERFANGVFFVPLAPLSAPENLYTAVAESLQFTFQTDQREPRQQLIDYFREKQLLLIMDNYEHMLASASFVSDVLQAAPQVQALVTSRERLNLSGETVFTLDGMDIPQTRDLAEALEYSALKLFMQAARRAKPGFELSQDEVEPAIRICELVYGMPLGILLAAAWVELLPVAEIVAEITQSLDFLETEMRDVPERHRSIRAVFEYSWHLLSEEERRVFIQLSIFRGGFERDAAQKVAGASLRTLGALVNKSLLIRDPRGRYAQHKLLGQYASETFEGDPEVSAVVHRQHAQYYTDFVSRLEGPIQSRKEKETVELIEPEFENIRAAWHWALDAGAFDLVDRMLHTMQLFYLSRSMQQEGWEALRYTADTLEAKGEGGSRLYWRVRSRQVWAGNRLATYEQNWQIISAVYAYFKEHHDTRECVLALNSMSYLRMMQGRYEEARGYAQSALDMLTDQDYGSPLWLLSMGNLGYTDFLQGDYEAALNVYDHTAIRTRDADRSPVGLAFATNNMGEVMQATGNTSRAMELFREAYAIFKSFNHRRGMGFTLNNMAGVYTMTGRFDDAAKMFAEAYALYRDVGDLGGIAHSLSALGNLAVFVNSDYPTALDYYNQSLNLRRELGDMRGVADSLSDLGDAHLAAGDAQTARRYFADSLAVRREIGDRQGLVVAMIWLGIAMHAQGEVAAVLRSHFDETLTLARETNNNLGIAQAWLGMAEVEILDQDYAQARWYLRQSLEIGHNFDIKPLKIPVVQNLGFVLYLQGEYAQALEILLALHNVFPYFSPVFKEREERAIQAIREILSPVEVQAIEERAAHLNVDMLADQLLSG